MAWNKQYHICAHNDDDSLGHDTLIKLSLTII
jgi:hypothetical protein